MLHEKEPTLILFIESACSEQVNLREQLIRLTPTAVSSPARRHPKLKKAMAATRAVIFNIPVRQRNGARTGNTQLRFAGIVSCSIHACRQKLFSIRGLVTYYVRVAGNVINDEGLAASNITVVI